jgi:hypothetical protein
VPQTLRAARRSRHGAATSTAANRAGRRTMRFRTARVARAQQRRINGHLTASGVKIGAEIKAEQIKRLKEPWQHRALLYYDLVPEIKYAGQFYSRHMSKVELRVELYDPETDEWQPSPDTQASDFLDRVQDPGGGRSTLIGTYGRLRFLTGESYLVCFAPDTSAERWEMLSADEFQAKDDGKGYIRKRGESMEPETWKAAPKDNRLDDPAVAEKTCLAWRLWRRHPRFSAQADSAMQACMDVCEELLLLTLAVRAQARSRIARSGVMAVPSEISPPPPEPRPNEDPQEDSFLTSLEAHMAAPMVEEGSPAQLVPLLVRGPAAYLKELRQIELNVAGANYPESALRTEAISRLANGLDMPREALLGTADVNHWGAWQIDQQTWEAHVQPVVEEMCDELTGAVLRPTLEDNGIQPAEARRYRVWYDAVKITNHPDRGKDAIDAYDRGELGGAALRDALGFDSEDAPTQAELAPPASDVVAPSEGEGETAPGDGGTGNDTPIGPPVAADQARLLGAAETALLSCRRTAGNRIVSKAPRDRTVQARLRAVDRDLLYARMDRTVLPSLNGGSLNDPLDLVKGGCDAFEKTLEAWGYPPDRISAISKLVQRHAAETLHEERPPALPPILLNM